MCLAFVLPLVVASGESDWFDAFARQIFSCMAVVVTAMIFGYLAETILRLPFFGQLGGSVAAGVGLGFIAGILIAMHSGGSQIWLLNQSFVPFGIQEFFSNNKLETTYAPACGMIAGMAMGLLYCYWRRRSIGPQNPSR